MKRLVYGREADQWTNRVMTDLDFTYFRVLQPTVSPSVVYRLCNRTAHRRCMHVVAKTWCRKYVEDIHVCKNCNIQVRDNIVHLVSECVSTALLRTKFICDITCCGIDFVGSLLELDGTMFVLKLMGAPIHPYLDDELNKCFLLLSFQYIMHCLTTDLRA